MIYTIDNQSYAKINATLPKGVEFGWKNGSICQYDNETMPSIQKLVNAVIYDNVKAILAEATISKETSYEDGQEAYMIFVRQGNFFDLKSIVNQLPGSFDEDSWVVNCVYFPKAESSRVVVPVELTKWDIFLQDINTMDALSFNKKYSEKTLVSIAVNDAPASEQLPSCLKSQAGTKTKKVDYYFSRYKIIF